jgi:hypothetical protein
MNAAVLPSGLATDPCRSPEATSSKECPPGRSSCDGRNPSRTWNLKISGVPKSVKLLELLLRDSHRFAPLCKTLGKCPLRAASHLECEASAQRLAPSLFVSLFFGASSVCIACTGRGGRAGRSAPRAYLRNSSWFGSWDWAICKKAGGGTFASTDGDCGTNWWKAGRFGEQMT